MTLLARELREARLALVRVNRKLALAHLEGPVAERDEKKWKVRLEIGEDPATGEKILSPWVRPHSNSAGEHKHSPRLPAKGDRMRMVSPSGVVGGASYALPSAFDDEVKRPEGQGEGATVVEQGKTRLSQTKDTLVRKTEKTTVSQTNDAIEHKTEKTSVKQSKDKIEITAEKEWRVESDEPHVKGKKKTRVEAPSRETLILKLGDSAWTIRPEALEPASD